MDTMTPNRSFPSTTHREWLSARVRSQKSDANSGLLPTECGYSSLSEREKLYYHSYDYAWRLARFQDESQSSPIDQQGKYYDQRLVDMVRESLYRIYPRKQRILPADDPRFSPEMREHFAAQDRERAALWRQVHIHGERDASGELTPEMEAYLACGMRNAHANSLTFIERNRAAGRRDPLDKVRDEMGVRALEC